MLKASQRRESNGFHGGLGSFICVLTLVSVFSSDIQFKKMFGKTWNWFKYTPCQIISNSFACNVTVKGIQ